jgi:hypothetical protein
MRSMDTKLTEFVKRLQDAVATNLESVILYGSAARGDFHEDHSDLNVLCVLGSLAVEELGRVSAVARWWHVEQEEPVPLFFTKEELRQSAGIFPIEILDMQDSRRVLYGGDVIENLEVPMNLHRVQLERDLRTVILKLRQHYLRAPGNAKELGPVMRKSFSAVLVLLRHVVIAFGEEPPDQPREIVARAAAFTKSNAAAFDPILKLREKSDLPGEIIPAYGAYLAALEVIIRALDQQMPKEEWRRQKSAQP